MQCLSLFPVLISPCVVCLYVDYCFWKRTGCLDAAFLQHTYFQQWLCPEEIFLIFILTDSVIIDYIQRIFSSSESLYVECMESSMASSWNLLSLPLIWKSGRQRKSSMIDSSLNLYHSSCQNTEPFHKPALCPLASLFHTLFVWLFPAVQKGSPPPFFALYIASFCSHIAQCQFQMDQLCVVSLFSLNTLNRIHFINGLRLKIAMQIAWQRLFCKDFFLESSRFHWGEFTLHSVTLHFYLLSPRGLYCTVQSSLDNWVQT